MASVIFIEKDTAPSILTYAVAGVPVDISNYTITLKIAFNPPLAKQAVIMDQNTDKGKFRFDWTADDLKPGTFQHEILVADAAGKEKTYKQGDIEIQRRIA